MIAALAQFQHQHAELRAMMDRCEALADELDAGRAGPEPLTQEVVRLRLAFDAHHQFEEEHLKPMLLETGALAEVRIDRMVEAHAAEHRAMGAQLRNPETRALRETLELLRAHLEAEDRYFPGASAPRAELTAPAPPR